MVRSVSYQVRVRVQGELDPTYWSGLFSELTVTAAPDGMTRLSGELADQAALHGLLATIRDLGLTLVSVESVASPSSDDQARRRPAARGTARNGADEPGNSDVNTTHRRPRRGTRGGAR